LLSDSWYGWYSRPSTRRDGRSTFNVRRSTFNVRESCIRHTAVPCAVAARALEGQDSETSPNFILMARGALYKRLATAVRPPKNEVQMASTVTVCRFRFRRVSDPTRRAGRRAPGTQPYSTVYSTSYGTARSTNKVRYCSSTLQQSRLRLTPNQQ
jgi:hypothetical protein